VLNKNLDIREEGKYLDLWSVNHFLSGVVFASWILRFTFNIWFIFGIYFILAVLWEVYEFYGGIFEHFGNKVMDVVTGVVGFLIIYGALVQGKPVNNLFAIFFTLLYVFLEVYCFVDYKRRQLCSSKSPHTIE
jgi:hypothetical protein